MEGTEGAHRNDPDLVTPKIIQGKDELNLAEFPLSAIAERTDPGQKTIQFEDRIWDESRGEMIARQLTITASDEYGLPTALDDEVILGLVQLSKLQNFAEREVSFTRYQLIQLLGWRDDSQSYERIEKSLNRWVGVTLYYKNAWWDKENKSWVDEKFHIIDNVTLYDREQAKHRKRAGQTALPLSQFTWNKVLFRSFEAGNLKSLDFDFYKTLNSAIAKRLYRFLDKRFFHRGRWEFDLKEVSWEHIGLSRNYDVANLKRKMLPGIRELEQMGFLQPMTDAERFRKVRSGEWRVIFEKARPRRAAKEVEVMDSGKAALVQALIERGVTASTAEDTVSNHPMDRITTQMEVFDWLSSKGDAKVLKNPAGFLVSSIRSEYVAPRGFVTKDEHERREAIAAEKQRKAAERERLEKEREESRKRSKDEAVRSFWQSLSEDERVVMEREAMAAATRMQRDVIDRGGSLAETIKKTLLENHAIAIMRQAA